MKLTSAQLEQFEREGYLFFPGLFSPQEIKVLTDDCLLERYDVPLPWKEGTPAEELQGNLKAA